MTQNDLPPLRYELKLLGHSTDLPRVKAWLRLHPEGVQTSYPVRYVNSVCFDSPSAARLETHRAGNGRRTKLRLRWYGALEGPAAAHWELKSREYTLG